VFEAPTLQYWVRQRSGAGQIVGPVFNPERYGIAVPLGSPLRKRINTALLEMQADGSFEAMRGRWFGQQR
jgi:polar amino acid transport system substrate-binding protein